FFVYDPSPPGISPLSLHDALPIFLGGVHGTGFDVDAHPAPRPLEGQLAGPPAPAPCTTEPLPQCHGPPQVAMRVVLPGEADPARSEEHTSELQSRENLVCRLLLEK